MTDPKIEPLNPVQIESATIPTEPMLNVYANSTRQAAEQSLKSLDASINWALTLTLAELAFVVNEVIVKGAASVDERILDLVLAAIGLGGAMCFHFSIRAAKNYLNLIRFSKLEREAIRCNFKIGSYSVEHLMRAIQSYHIEWRSPLGLRVIAKKVLFEFGNRRLQIALLFHVGAKPFAKVV